jgi:hypothetical protein
LAVLATQYGVLKQWLDPQSATFPARAFGLTPIYDRPGGTVVGSLAPDSVHIVRTVGEWFVTEHGFVPRIAMQPIRPYTPPIIESHAAAPFWAELIAPSSAVRAWCDPRAPVRATFGHGAVVCVLGTLTDDRGGVWYEIERGWVTAAHFAWVEIRPCGLVGPCGYVGPPLHIDLGNRVLRLYSGRRLVLQSAFYGGATLTATSTERIQTLVPGDASGLPWQMRLGSGVIMRGAWDHNRFGLPGGGSDVELPPEVAKLIYGVLLENDCTVHVEG